MSHLRFGELQCRGSEGWFETWNEHTPTIARPSVEVPSFVAHLRSIGPSMIDASHPILSINYYPSLISHFTNRGTLSTSGRIQSLELAAQPLFTCQGLERHTSWSALWLRKCGCQFAPALLFDLTFTCMTPLWPATVALQGRHSAAAWLSLVAALSCRPGG
jgi:hypothetical protein